MHIASLALVDRNRYYAGAIVFASVFTGQLGKGFLAKAPSETPTLGVPKPC